MAIKHMTYLELPSDLRREGATTVRERLQGQLSAPFLTGDQRRVLVQEMDRVAAWEQGRIPVVHTVDLVDDVPVDSKIG